MSRISAGDCEVVVAGSELVLDGDVADCLLNDLGCDMQIPGSIIHASKLPNDVPMQIIHKHLTANAMLFLA